MANLITSVGTWARQGVSLLRLREFDTSTVEGRSRERYRRVALAALSSAGAKAVTVVTLLLAVPLTLNYLGPERYGLWMTISSLVAIMGFADLGIGLGLMNAVSEAHGREDRQAAINYVSSGFFLLAAMALLILMLFALVYPHIAWSRVFNVQSPRAVLEAGPAMAVFLACFAANLPLGVVQRVQWGFQEGYYNNLWDSAGKVLGLLGLVLVIYLQGGLPWLVAALAGAPVLALGLNNLILFGWRRPWLRPAWKHCQLSATQRLLGTGLFFFVHQMSHTVVFSSDNVIIAHFLGPAAVTQYAVPYQLFSFAIVIYTALLGPLWPAYAEALARGDMAWVKKTLTNSLVFILVLIGGLSALLVLIGKQLLHVWVGPQIAPSFLLRLGLGVWMVVLAVGNSLGMLLNAANVFRFQLIFLSLNIFFALGFKCLFVYLFALPGIIWGTVLVYIIFIIIPYAVFIEKVYFKKHDKAV